MTQLADPQAAIASYLDDLLHTATDQALQQDTQAQVVVARPTAAITPRPLPVKPEPVIAEPLVQAVVAPQPAPVAGSQARPEWAEKPFECLIFTVAGLQLAVPLVLLGAIHRIEDDIMPMPGSPPWYMGIRRGRDKNLRVVDSAEWIMAGRAPANARANYRFVIHLNNSDWGLACDNVAQSFTLSPQQVRWRTSRSKRPWLAGTVIEQMCALLDVQSMANLLVRAEREQHLDLS
jgi:purine-binding chemotaxis protein CheW